MQIEQQEWRQGLRGKGEKLVTPDFKQLEMSGHVKVVAGRIEETKYQ